ncbi:MAG TPA: DNA repair protein RecO [Saprospiraceae bacterium]|nr:DNA repair protein RecO [Saprospiraceae bacterium]HQW56082.1 DNA repair protein RecO [Saprospiraceae bacterium]
MSTLRKDDGIILRTLKYGETSLIADVFTLDEGMKSFILQGARSQKSAYSPTSIQVMAIVHLDYYANERSGLNRMKELRLARSYDLIPLEFPRRAIGLFLCELTRKSLIKYQVNRELYNLLDHTLRHLDQAKHFADLHIWYLLRIAQLMGFGIQWGSNDTDDKYFDLLEGNFTSEKPIHDYFIAPTHCLLLTQIQEFYIFDENAVMPKTSDRKILLEKLLQYFKLHHTGFQDLTSYSVLLEVFK